MRYSRCLSCGQPPYPCSTSFQSRASLARPEGRNPRPLSQKGPTAMQDGCGFSSEQCQMYHRPSTSSPTSPSSKPAPHLRHRHSHSAVSGPRKMSSDRHAGQRVCVIALTSALDRVTNSRIAAAHASGERAPACVRTANPRHTSSTDSSFLHDPLLPGTRIIVSGGSVVALFRLRSKSSWSLSFMSPRSHESEGVARCVEASAVPCLRSG